MNSKKILPSSNRADWVWVLDAPGSRFPLMNFRPISGVSHPRKEEKQGLRTPERKKEGQGGEGERDTWRRPAAPNPR